MAEQADWALGLRDRLPVQAQSDGFAPGDRHASGWSAFSLTEIALCCLIEQIHRLPDRFEIPIKPDLL